MKLYVFKDCSSNFMRGNMGIQEETLEAAILVASHHAEHPTSVPSDDVNLIYEVVVESNECGLVFNDVEML